MKSTKKKKDTLKVKSPKGSENIEEVYEAQAGRGFGNSNYINNQIQILKSDEVLGKISCICIVQHHDIIKQRIDEIYCNSKVPLIYDCQNKIIQNKNSNTTLDGLGNYQ